MTCTRRVAGGRALHVLAFVAVLAALLIFVPAAGAQLEHAWFEGNLSYGEISGPGFTPDASVTIVVKDSPGGATLYSASAPVGVDGSFAAVPQPWEVGVDLVPGMYISVSEGAITKDVTLAALSIDAIDPAENTVSGTAPPNAEFGVDADVGGQWPGLVVTADENGDWTADFDDIGIDITLFTHVGAAIFNDNGGATAVDLWIRTPEEGISYLVDSVTRLVDVGTLAPRTARPLKLTLRMALCLVEAGRPRAAVAMLQGFNALVRADVRSRRLPAESGAALIGTAKEIISALR